MKLFIREKYVNRHLILKTLQKHYSEHDSPNATQIDVSLSFSKLVEKSKLKESQIIEQLPYLQKEKEISDFDIDFSSFYIIEQEGRVAYYDKKHFSIGRKMFRDEIYDTVKTISAIILLIIGIITFIINFTETKDNKKKIENIQKEIQSIKTLKKLD